MIYNFCTSFDKDEMTDGIDTEIVSDFKKLLTNILKNVNKAN